MVPTRDVDPAALYGQERVALIDRLRTVGEDELATPVPATPAWTVHDVVAHLAGIAADLNAQRFPAPGSDPEAWTAHQVEARRDASLEDLASEWAREGLIFEDGLRLFGHEFAAHYLGDLVQHVSDVHAALGWPVLADDRVVAVALDFYLRSFEEALADAGVGAVGVRVIGGSLADERFTLGEGAVVASVAGPRFTLLRAVGGRRTIEEIRALEWSGDAELVAPLVSRYPLPTESLGPG